MKFTDEQKAVMRADFDLTADQLKEKYGGEDGEHPVLNRALFELDRKLMFGDPYYWRYVETCLIITKKRSQ